MFTNPRQVLGKYHLIAEIARGGMGVVYLAMAQGPGGFNKLVVVKELSPELADDPAFHTMFLDEAKLAARLNHANIVQTNEVSNDGHLYFMVMEYLDGRGLDRIRRRARTMGIKLPLPMQLRIISDMLAGLDYAHNLTDYDGTPLNVIHRDVSPQNVFVTFDGQIKLIDFGIAKAADTSHQTHAGVLKGKIAYMSPEQARGEKADARSDVFSAGVMLWEALTGQSLRDGKNDQQMLWALATADLPRASTVRPSVPPELDAICARAMAWKRDQRYPSAGALRADLERYLITSGTNVSAREVGADVAEVFAEDRAKSNALIEAHVARIRGGAARGELPVIDVASRSAAGSTPSTSAGRLLPSRTPRETSSTDQPASLLMAASSGPRIAERSTRANSLILIGGAVVATALCIGFVALRSRAAPPPAAAHLAIAPPPEAAPPPAPAVAASASQAAALASKPNRIHVEIRVSPPTAKLEIDETEVAGSPFAGSYPVDTAVHRVRATAPGYVSKSVTVGFDANVRLDLGLERLPEPAQEAQPAQDAQPAQQAVASPRPVARWSPPARSPLPAKAALAKAPAPARVATTAPSPSLPAAAPSGGAEPKPAPAPAPALSNEVNPAGGSKPHRAIDSRNPYETQ